jgi:general secretion pathway protein J
MSRWHNRHQKGFTLLELLIALSIFSVVVMMAYQGLNDILSHSEHTEKRAEQLAELQMAMMFISRDIEQLLPRSIRDGLGDPQAPLISEGHGGEYRIEFTRGGWPNPIGQKRSTLQRVAYGIQEGKLIRYHWLVLDRAQDSEPVATELLSNVEELKFEFSDGSDEKKDSWPPFNTTTGQQGSELPLVIKMTLELKHYGGVWRLFKTVGEMPSANAPN